MPIRRDSWGRFTGGGFASNRRARKISKLQRKNTRVKKQYARDTNLHGTGFGHSIERSIAARQNKIMRLQAKQGRRATIRR